MLIKICPVCGNGYNDETKVCSGCGNEKMANVTKGRYGTAIKTFTFSVFHDKETEELIRRKKQEDKKRKKGFFEKFFP